MKEQIETIRSLYGDKVANYASNNLAGWVIERLADTRVCERGPQAGQTFTHIFTTHTSGYGAGILRSALSS